MGSVAHCAIRKWLEYRRDTWPQNAETLRMVSQIKAEAVTRRGIAAARLPTRYERWLSED